MNDIVYIVVLDKYNFIIKQGKINAKLGKLYSVTVENNDYNDVSEIRFYKKKHLNNIFLNVHISGEKVTFFDKNGYLQHGLVKRKIGNQYDIFINNILLKKYSHSDEFILWSNKGTWEKVYVNEIFPTFSP